MESKNRKFGVILLALVVLLTAALVFTGSANAKTLYVDDDDGPEINFNTLQDAIESANSGDSIFVFSGTYKENVNINKDNLIIIGESKSNTTIQGIGKTCVYISAKQIAFSGFTLQNGEYGLRLNEAEGNKISDCVITFCSSDGIRL